MLRGARTPADDRAACVRTRRIEERGRPGRIADFGAYDCCCRGGPPDRKPSRPTTTSAHLKRQFVELRLERLLPRWSHDPERISQLRVETRVVRPFRFGRILLRAQRQDRMDRKRNA